ncbi:MAG: serine--tRNA ligase [Bacteroidia bacterium]|nr:serine--tRNA ligase [Bacteroidia bacterium]MDW8158554.1 serine--tRNA ligase [Bacteroidia bacterium]
MIQLQVIQQETANIIRKLQLKKYEATQEIERLVELDKNRRALLQSVESKRAEMNKIAKEVGIAIAQGNNTAAETAKKQTAQLKASISEEEEILQKLENEIHQLLAQLPNPPHDSVPIGKSSEENVIVYQNEIAIQLFEEAKCHWDIVTEKKLIDFERGSKISGAGFPVYYHQGAKLQRALINFFLDQATHNGYLEVQPPILVNPDSAFGTGQLPDKDGQMYYINQDELYLIPTAEVPITNLYRDEIIEESELPIKLCGYTPCFRREAGSYGKDVRGLNRLHQFDKVEIVQITHPDTSYETLEEMVNYVKTLLDKLELPYRVALLCTGDLGFASAKTYDMEVYSAAQKKWLEVSSISNFESYQANRLKLRIKSKNQKRTFLAHTLNGSALALPRIVAAMVENFQQKDGSILLPKALIPYFGADRI